ncbi:MAG: YcxB family protein [Anaerolineae bacterium]|nr:YcxB family protein [Anaerolineae bacterium]
MVIDSTMPKSTYIRLSLLLFFQNKFLYIYLAVCGLVTAYALSTGNYGLLFIAWLPYLAYLALGIFTTVRNSSAENQPFLLPTRYTFQKKEITTKTSLGEGNFKWDEFIQWRTLADCYILLHQDNFILAIPKSAVPKKEVEAFETMLKERIGQE